VVHHLPVVLLIRLPLLHFLIIGFSSTKLALTIDDGGVEHSPLMASDSTLLSILPLIA
jgi:hypothetical protein